MADIDLKGEIVGRVVFSVSESEARALDALVGYGDDAFVKAFYENLGKAYMQQHEAGLRSLFASIRGKMPAVLSRFTKAREAFNGKDGAA